MPTFGIFSFALSRLFAYVSALLFAGLNAPSIYEKYLQHGYFKKVLYNMFISSAAPQCVFEFEPQPSNQCMFEAWFWRMAAPFRNWAHKVYLMSCLEEKFQLSELFLCFTLHCRCLQMFTNLVDSFTLVSCRRSQLDLLHLLIFISNISEILYKKPGRLRY